MKLNRDDVVLLQGSSVAQTADGFSVTPEFIGNGRGLHSSTCQLNLNRFRH